MTDTLTTEQVEAIVAFAAEIEWLEPRVAMDPRFSAGVSSLATELLALRKRVEWQDISTAPKNRKVLAAYKNPLGNWRVVTACYHTELPWADDHYPHDSDSEFAPEGWYEESDSAEMIFPTSEVPTLWMPITYPTPKEPS